jgi:DNA replication protein DnaC
MEEISLASVCPLCEGSGLKIIERPDGSRAARDCACQLERRAARAIARTRIPKRYEHCTLDEFDTAFSGCTDSVKKGYLNAKKFVDSFPVETRGNGLLFTGSIGAGKTHLSVAILQALVTQRGASGLFCDYRELLKQVQNTYNRAVQATELDVLRPVFEAEILVIDEIGAAKPTDWVWDTVAHILNTRYNDRKTTILTANYSNRPPLGATFDEETALTQARRARQEDTLGDRIGERMRSRLQEMCVVVEMNGADFRQTVNRAQLG